MRAWTRKWEVLVMVVMIVTLSDRPLRAAAGEDRTVIVRWVKNGSEDFWLWWTLTNGVDIGL